MQALSQRMMLGVWLTCRRLWQGDEIIEARKLATGRRIPSAEGGQVEPVLTTLS
jgi:hypothetical protein